MYNYTFVAVNGIYMKRLAKTDLTSISMNNGYVVICDVRHEHFLLHLLPQVQLWVAGNRPLMQVTGKTQLSVRLCVMKFVIKQDLDHNMSERQCECGDSD